MCSGPCAPRKDAVTTGRPVVGRRGGGCARAGRTPPIAGDPFSGGSEGIECGTGASSDATATAPFLPGRGPSGGRTVTQRWRDCSYCTAPQQTSREIRVTTIHKARDSGQTTRRMSADISMRVAGLVIGKGQARGATGNRASSQSQFPASLIKRSTSRMASSGGIPIRAAKSTRSLASAGSDRWS